MPQSQIYLAETTLTNAQTLALPTTPVALVPAVADSVIYPFFVHLRTVWVADYTNIDAAALLNVVTNTTNLVWPLREAIGSSVSALLAGGGPDGTHAFLSPRFTNGAALSDSFSGLSNLYDSDIVNQPLVLDINNGGSGNLTGGDAGNSLIVQVIYMILPT